MFEKYRGQRCGMRAVRVFALFFTAAVAAAFGQQNGPVATASGSGLVRLNVVVQSGGKGAPVPNLPQNSFSVLDNGAVQPIRSFRAITGQAQPVKVLIVIDAVNVGYERIAYERQQLDKLLHGNDGRLPQPTAIAIFTDNGTQIQPAFTTDGNAISQELAKQVIGLRDLRRSAGFYGAEERLQLSLKTADQLLTHAATEPGRKIILWLSPGWPLLSGPEVQLTARQQQEIFREVVGFSDELRKANVTMYAVDPLGAGEGPGRTFYFEEFLKGIRKPSQALPGDLGVQVLSVQSGGLFLAGNNDIGAMLDQCFADTKAFYEITYQQPPAETADQYHSVQVKVAEPRMTARTLQGYYAQP
jgi:VWFA-related protein